MLDSIKKNKWEVAYRGYNALVATTVTVSYFTRPDATAMEFLPDAAIHAFEALRPNNFNHLAMAINVGRVANCINILRNGAQGSTLPSPMLSYAFDVAQHTMNTGWSYFYSPVQTAKLDVKEESKKDLDAKEEEEEDQDSSVENGLEDGMEASAEEEAKSEEEDSQEEKAGTAVDLQGEEGVAKPAITPMLDAKKRKAKEKKQATNASPPLRRSPRLNPE